VNQGDRQQGHAKTAMRHAESQGDRQQGHAKTAMRHAEGQGARKGRPYNTRIKGIDARLLYG
jgi:hypothetical protein